LLLFSLVLDKRTKLCEHWQASSSATGCADQLPGRAHDQPIETERPTT
jgi:hypothetical protein